MSIFAELFQNNYSADRRMTISVSEIMDKYGREYRRLIKLGLPVMVTQLGIIVVAFADTMMVAAYDTKALAAAAFVNSIFLVAIVMQLGFASGLTPLVGALFSRGDKDGVGALLRAGVGTNIMVSLAFTAVLGAVWFFLDRFGQPEELLPMIRPYYLIVLSTLLPMAVFNTFQQTSNGCTDTATPMWLIISGNVINVIGNYTLIFGHLGMPELGLTGAGISTLTARLLMAVAMVAIYLRSRSRRPYIEGWRKATEVAQKWKRVWVTSYPVMIQSGVECFLWTFGAIVSGWYGTVQLASYQVVNTVAQLGFMTYMGFGVATSIRVANLTGLGDTAGVKRTTAAGLHLTLVLATVASLVFLLFFEQMIHLFTPDMTVVAAAMPLLLPLILYQYGDAVQLTYANAIRGTSDVRPLQWVAVLSYLVVGIPMVYFMAVTLDMHNVGVYYSFSVALFMAAALLCISFRRIIRRTEAGQV